MGAGMGEGEKPHTTTTTTTNTHTQTPQQSTINDNNQSRIHNADVHMAEDYDIDDLVDVIEGSRVYIPAIYVINKIDQITIEELEVMSKLPHYCPVSVS